MPETEPQPSQGPGDAARGPMRLVYVVGMHRSGTSAATHVLSLLGLSVGPLDSLIPATPNNPRGHWEQQAVCALNDEILAAHGGAWDSPPRLARQWTSTRPATSFLPEARRLVAELRHAESDAYVVKDPRFAITLPLWELARPADGVVLPIRDPRAVCQSLGRRNRMPLPRAAELWLAYTRSALQNAPEPVIVDYANLLARPLQTAESLCHSLSLELTDEARRAIPGELDGRLDHLAPELVDPLCVELDLARAVHDLLVRGDLVAAREVLSDS